VANDIPESLSNIEKCINKLKTIENTKDDEKYKQIDIISKELIIENEKREMFFIYSKLGILEYINKSKIVYQLLDIKHIASEIVNTELIKNKVPYITIIPNK